MMLSAANVFYHDVNYLWGIVSQLLFYITPIIYFPATLQLGVDQRRLLVLEREFLLLDRKSVV